MTSPTDPIEKRIAEIKERCEKATDVHWLVAKTSAVLTQIKKTLEGNNYGYHPRNLLVCHHCDNPNCVNPFHLFLGSFFDNAEDMSLKGRFKLQPITNRINICKSGLHKMEGRNLITKPIRQCRECLRIRRAISRRKKRENVKTR